MKKILITFVAASIWIVGFYGFYTPILLEKNKPEIEEFLNLNGLKPIELIDINGWKTTTTWRVLKPDSTEAEVLIQMRRGNYVINTRRINKRK